MQLPDLRPEEDTLEPVETWPVDRLRALQMERLRWSLRHAHERVPQYRHAFEDAKAHPDDLDSLASLRRFPFTTRRDLRHAYPFGLLALPRERLARLHASAGTTGAPILTASTERDLAVWASLMARSLRAAGIRPGWAVLVAHPYGMTAFGLGNQAGAEKHGCAVIPASDLPAEQLVQLIRDLRPEAILATPSQMPAFLAAGHDPRQSSLQVAVLGGEPWTDATRTEIEGTFRLHALDSYGLVEMMGPGVAQECLETKDGLTLWEDHFYPEIIDPRTGRLLPEGEPGELVLTSLTREAMPLIRYRTGDIARLLPGTARTMRRIGRIERQAR